MSRPLADGRGAGGSFRGGAREKGKASIRLLWIYEEIVRSRLRSPGSRDPFAPYRPRCQVGFSSEHRWSAPEGCVRAGARRCGRSQPAHKAGCYRGARSVQVRAKTARLGAERLERIADHLMGGTWSRVRLPVIRP
jgi:hypothetical protein